MEDMTTMTSNKIAAIRINEVFGMVGDVPVVCFVL
jgi:hypothetical protein